MCIVMCGIKFSSKKLKIESNSYKIESGFPFFIQNHSKMLKIESKFVEFGAASAPTYHPVFGVKRPPSFWSNREKLVEN